MRLIDANSVTLCKIKVMDIQKLNIGEISVNPENPRTISKDKFEDLIKSILTFPRMLVLRKLVVDCGSGNICLGGNMRYRALCAVKDMDLSEIRTIVSGSRKFADRPEKIDKILAFWGEWKKDPIVQVEDGSDLSDEEKREFIIKDNVPFGEWDYDDLSNKWDTNDLEEWGLDLWNEDPEEEPKKEDQPGGSAFEIVVSCDNEADQKILSEELKSRGYNIKTKSV